MKIIEEKQKKYKGYYIIEGFPSPDLIATIATKYLIDTLKMQEIGYFDCKEFYPIVRVNNGVIQAPIRIYASEKYKLLAILPDQLIPNNLIYEYSKTLIDWAKNKKIKGIITLTGVKNNKNKIEIYGITNHIKHINLLKEKNIPLLKDGLTSGISAQLMLIEKDLPIYLILGTYNNNIAYEVAANILEKLSEIFNLNIDTKPLLKESEKIMAQLKEKIKEIETHKDPKPMMYT